MTFWGIRIILKETHREHLSRQSWEPSAIPEVEDQLLTGSWWRPEERQIRQQNTMWIIWGYAMHRQIYLYYIILYYVMLCYVILCYIVLYCIVWYHIISYYIISYYIILCYVMLCYVMLCYIILYYIILYILWNLGEALSSPLPGKQTKCSGVSATHCTQRGAHCACNTLVQKRGRHFGSLSFFWQ